MSVKAEALNMGGEHYDGRVVSPTAAPSGLLNELPVRSLSQYRTENGLDGTEAEPAREKMLGQYEYLPFHPKQLVSLSQIRGERNIVTDELKEDILYQGLINPVDVALVTREMLEEYIRFTNQTWGAEATIEEYLEYQLADGRFPLLISGHSRHQAVRELIDEQKLSDDTLVMAKVLEAKNVFDIVQWQRGENIHSVPARERTAMALVESYMYGIATGEWSSEQEFIDIQESKGRTVGKGPLDQALKYARLAPRIRNFILSGEVPYLAGVEMGATMEILSEYIVRSNGYDGLEDPKLQNADRMQTVRKIIEVEMDRICNRITGDNLNSTSAQKIVQARRKSWTDAVRMMRPGKKKDEEPVLQFDFIDDGLDRALAAERRALRRDLEATKHKYGGHDIPAFFKLQKGILPDSDVQELLVSFEQELLRTRQTLGAYTATVAENEDTLFA